MRRGRVMHSQKIRVFAMAAVAALLLSPAGPAASQQPTKAQQSAIKQACRADYQAHCASIQGGGAAGLACLQQNAAQLSSPCQAAVSAAGGGAGGGASAAAMTQPPAASAAPAMSPRQQLAVLRGACGADYRRYCRGVRPGGGRAMACLQDHSASLSNVCRGALSRAAP